jgi:D-lactate dehydrogenase (cytochrome)
MPIRANRVGVASACKLLLPILRERLGSRVTIAQSVLAHHSHGEGGPDGFLPDIVVFALEADDVAFVVQQCSANLVPVIPFGSGTSVEGHVAAVLGGVCVDLSRMNAIIAVSPDALDCRVQAGVTREQLNIELRSHGLFFPVDPGANASLGGMAATRASGTTAVRYGTMREAILGLTVVTADGRIVRTGGRARKSAAGLDLTRLFVGSEGILGVITEVQLKVWGLPESVRATVCQFPDLKSAVQTVTSAMQMGIPLARVELLDALQMKACIAYSKLNGYKELPTLFIEFHGGPEAVDEQVVSMESLSLDAGGMGFSWAQQPEDRTLLWKARHEVVFANYALRPGFSQISTDACVPISQLVQCIEETSEDVRRSGLLAPLCGHVGDGNFHLSIMFDPNSVGECNRAEALADSVAMRSIRLGGTCTGEHGIGMHRIHQLEAEHGEGVELMRAIKSALDPLGIMNPGKMLKF